MAEHETSLGDIFIPFSMGSIERTLIKGCPHLKSEHAINVGFSIGTLTLNFAAFKPSDMSIDDIIEMGITDSTLRAEAIQEGLKNRVNCVTPFAPQIGYQISTDDYDKGARFNKLLRQHRERVLIIEGEDEHPMELFIASEGDLSDLGLGTVEEGVWRGFNKLADERFVKRLRMQVMFPDWLAYESQPDSEQLRLNGVLDFSHFYPLSLDPLIESKPLADLTGTILGLTCQNGVNIRLPDDNFKLNQIQARMTLSG